MSIQDLPPRPETGSARFSRALKVGRENLAAWRDKRRDGQAWADAEGFDDLCELTAQFCEGERGLTPDHGAPRDPETHEIADELAHANREGFLTTGSQPGVMGIPEKNFHEQRAFVEGFASKKVVKRLQRLVRGTRLVIEVRPMRRWRSQQVFGREGEVVTRDASRVYTDIGSLPSIRNVRSGISFGGACSAEAVREVENCYAVLILDPEWGDHRLLWDILARL